MHRLLILLLLLISVQLLANEQQLFGQRSFVLLPISDELNGSLGFEVFEEVEKYLKVADWCQYKSNSDIINILSRYRKNLSEHLADQRVLSVIAEKMEQQQIQLQ